MPQRTECLTWRRCPDETIAPQIEREGVGLVKRIPAVSRLRVDIDACDMEPGALQALGRPTGATPAPQNRSRARGCVIRLFLRVLLKQKYIREQQS